MSQQGLQAAEVLARRYLDAVASLQPDEWQLPSRCAGWSVQDLVAHTGSNFHLVVDPAAGPDNPPAAAERLQDLLVEQRRDWSTQQVADELEHNTEPALAAFRAMQDEPLASAPVTLSELGTYPLHALADAFAFDLWCHLYIDMLAPTGPVQRPVPEPEHDVLAPGIGWMLTGLPQMCPALGDVLDRPLGLRLTGPGGGSWVLEPGTPHITVTDITTDAGAAAVATSSAVDFVLWGTARVPWRDVVTIQGDESYAARVLDQINIV